MRAHLSWCVCGHTIDYLGTQLLWCPYESEHTTGHDTFQYIVATIILESETHVQKGGLPPFLSPHLTMSEYP
jgi:hypothetical protein